MGPKRVNRRNRGPKNISLFVSNSLPKSSLDEVRVIYLFFLLKARYYYVLYLKLLYITTEFFLLETMANKTSEIFAPTLLKMKILLWEAVCPSVVPPFPLSCLNFQPLKSWLSI